MSATDVFFDTNVLLYLLSEDEARANRAEALIAGGGTVSVQVLNEFVAVATRKLGMTLTETREMLSTIRAVCAVKPVDIETHDLGLDLVGSVAKVGDVDRRGMIVFHKSDPLEISRRSRGGRR